MDIVKPKIVAEIGCVHLGNLERAKHLVDLAILCQVDYVKFQKRNPIESVPKNIQNKPHPNQIFSYGATYLEHRQNLELNIEQHKEIKNYCGNKIKYSCSVWDKTSASEIISLDPDFIKVGSSTNKNKKVLETLIYDYKGDIHVSLGMLSPKEKEELIGDLISFKCDHRFVLYHCTSEYPCSFDRLFLLEIFRLKERLKGLKFRIGFSNHGYGIAADIFAWSLGAEWIERHFVDDRTLKHTDAAFSLEPAGLSKLCRDIKNICSSLQYKDGVTKEELKQIEKMRSV